MLPLVARDPTAPDAHQSLTGKRTVTTPVLDRKVLGVRLEGAPGLIYGDEPSRHPG